MELLEQAIGRRDREAVGIVVDASPLRGLPIPPCSIQAVAVARHGLHGPFLLYLGTDNGHLLLFTLSNSASLSSSRSISSKASGTPVAVASSNSVLHSPGASVPGPPSSGIPIPSSSHPSSESSLRNGGSSKSPVNGAYGLFKGSGHPGDTPPSGELPSSGGSGSPSHYESAQKSSASRVLAVGTEMVLRKRRIMGKAPIQALCALPDSGRIVILFDGQVSLLDMRSLGSLERLAATKGASALSRATSASSPSSISSNSEAEEQGEPEASSSGRKTQAGGGFVEKLGMPFGRRASQSDSTLSRMFAPPGGGLSKLAISVRKKIFLYEVRAVEPPPQVDKSSGKERRVNIGWDDATTVSATKLREVVSVDGIVTMAWLENVIIAGTQQEYILFSLTSGQATVLFSLPQDLPYPPLLKLFPKDLEVLLLTDNVGILVNSEGQPTAGSLLFSTVPDAIGQTAPYVVVVKQGHIELHHRKTGAKIQSLDLAGASKGRYLVADDDDGSFVVVASSSKVWCLQQVSLDDQVRDLLKQRQISEAVRLAEEAVTDGGEDAAKERLAVVHAEAGFLLLFDLNFEQAMDHFLLADILQPSELFPFFPPFTSRWRNLIPRKRYWGLHPPQQPIQTVIDSGLLAMQSGVLVLANESKVLDLLAQGPSSKSALNDHYLSSAMKSFSRYLRVVRGRELKPGVDEGVDTLLLRLYTELHQTTELEELAASPNSCVLEEVETTLKAAAQLRTLALLYETKGLVSLALEVWQTMALDQGNGDSHTVAAGEAARLLESSSDSALVLQHTGWILRLDPRLALTVLTSSKRSQPLPPGDVLTLLNDEGGLVRQRYLQWLVQEKGSEATLYHTELALSLAKAALQTILPSAEGMGTEERVSQEYESSQRDIDSLSRGGSMNHAVVRDMLQTFLAASDKYEADEVLSLIQGSELWKEQVILHQKLGDETAALRILALKLEDSEAARSYCAELGRPEAYLELLDMYLKPGEGREPMHGAAVRLLHCHGASLDPLKVLEALSPDMSLSLASQTISRMLRARVHRHRQGQIVKHLNRLNNLEARVDRVEERSRQVCITADTACGHCRARIGTKLFALFPDDSVVCYKCSRTFGEHINPITGQDFLKEPAARLPRNLIRTNSSVT